MNLLLGLAAFLWLPLAAVQSESCNATLAISPRSGPVGTVVMITGRGFTVACYLAGGTNGDGLILQSGGSTSTFGYAPVADPGREPPVAADGTFSYSYTIPPNLLPFHGVGGGVVGGDRHVPPCGCPRPRQSIVSGVVRPPHRKPSNFA